MSKKINIPHGHFKRRFSHKRKSLFGLRTKLYDRVKAKWVSARNFELDFATLHIIDCLPESSLDTPSSAVTTSYVEHGVSELPDPMPARPAQVIDAEQFRAQEAAHMAERERERADNAEHRSWSESFETTSNSASDNVRSSDNGSSDFGGSSFGSFGGSSYSSSDSGSGSSSSFD